MKGPTGLITLFFAAHALALAHNGVDHAAGETHDDADMTDLAAGAEATMR